ncbi:MAG TPA: ABC transporter substrate-binding protein [Devosiaceae bacterium]|jgi:ABC-type branched-subunit amino acid transport system substrate-binding protein
MLTRLGNLLLGISVATVGLAFVLPAQAQDDQGDAQLPPIHIGLIIPAMPTDPNDLKAPIAKAAKQGAVMAEEEFTQNAAMFDADFAAVTAEASGGDAVVKAAEHLVNDEKVFALAGGFDRDEALALSKWSAEHNIPFLNLGASSDALRNDQCAATTFHLAPSAAMYLDALSGWYVRAGFRKWYFVQADNDESKEQYQRAEQSIDDRHFAAREVGHAVVPAGSPLPDSTLSDIKNSGADLVVMLVGSADQLSVLKQLEGAGISTMVTGFPYPETQTRTFFEASAHAAPKLGTGMRAEEWEPTIDAYGARELNARYEERWHEPMEGSAWAAYQAVKIFYEAAVFTTSTAPTDILGYMNSPDTVFDVWKGIGTSFRPWDRQLRQSLFLVKIDDTATDPKLVGQLVGELPEIYMPGTDPIERLDQLGDLQGQSRCH